MLGDIILILLLILLNGVFAMTELAVVSSRKSRLRALAEKGNRSARVALSLKEDPSKFLSTVQIGITLIGIFSGAYSGVTLSEPLAGFLAERFAGLGERADDVAIAIVVSSVTYLSLVIGELVPKQIALRHADGVAVAIALPIRWLSIITRPLVLLLDVSNKLVLKLLRVRPDHQMTTSTEDVKAIIAEGTLSGVLEPEEKQMLERVMRLDDIPITATMTHRKDIVWIDVNESSESVLHKVQETRHSRYLLCEKSVEEVIGLVVVKDVLLQLGNQKRLDLRKVMHKVRYMPDTTSVLEALEEFKQSTSNLAAIVDEHGDLQGLVTLKDVMEVIVGTLPEPAHREDYTAHKRDDGSWLIDGGLSVHEAEEIIGVTHLSGDDYTTLAGFVMHRLGHIPKAGEVFEHEGWRFEVMDMDGRRVDKVLVSEL